jgi:hypothetical protein
LAHIADKACDAQDDAADADRSPHVEPP